MPLYTPNRGSIIPTSGAPEGDYWSERAVAHPSILLIPLITETLPVFRPGIAGDYLCPPPEVVAAMYAKSWRVDAEIKGSGLSINLSDHNMAPYETETWTQSIRRGTSSIVDRSEGVLIGSSLRLNVSVSSLNLWYSWSDQEWWPGLRVIIETTDEDADYPFSSWDEIGAFRGEEDYEGESAVRLTYCGTIIPLYRTIAGGPPISGDITIQPRAYLDVV